MNDQTAQMGFQVGKTAVMAGQEYMEQNVCGSLGSRWRSPALIACTVKGLCLYGRAEALL